MADKIKTCPTCPKIATNDQEVEAEFGYRVMDGKKRPQSYCRTCRSAHSKKMREKHRKVVPAPVYLPPVVKFEPDKEYKPGTIVQYVDENGKPWSTWQAIPNGGLTLLWVAKAGKAK